MVAINYLCVGILTDAYCYGNKRLLGKKKSAQESRGQKNRTSIDKRYILFFLTSFWGRRGINEDENPVNYKGKGNKNI